MTVKFSVVINTYNRAVLLDDAIRGLSELNYSDYEVIVVNGPSTDHTENILEKWQGKIKLGRCAEPNLSMSRNIGVELAAGEVIAFIDDDAVPHPDWLKQLAPHYLNPLVGGVGGFTLDNTGVNFQACKTVCDRFGNAYYPTDFFDERPLSFVGSPFYPSLLGTNSSFRSSALREIGGFDHTFAYLLDETDVCLRLVDQGYRIVYEANALVFHQFAPSHIRSKNKIAKTLYPSAISKAYFIRKHGHEFSEPRAITELKNFQDELLNSNKWFADHQEISQEHRVSLDNDVLFGIQEGSRRAMQALVTKKLTGDLATSRIAEDFLPMPRKAGLTIALVSRAFPPNKQDGIARWSWLMAAGLAERDHIVHVITQASSTPYSRYENGYWIHAIAEDHSENGLRLAVQRGVPAGIAGWCAAVAQQVKKLKAFGLEVVSFPIWDLEGMAVVNHESVAVVMSLHTSYAMAKPFKPEWSERPLFEHFHVNKIIAAETAMLQKVPHILANSQAIMDDLTAHYAVDFADRTLIAAHGTLDPFHDTSVGLSAKPPRSGHLLKIAYIGRFEPRKGFDLACSALAALLISVKDIEITFAGGILDEAARHTIQANGAETLLNNHQVSFSGILSRSELDALFIQSDVVLMPSRYESFGLVAIEAMAAGTPVIALAVGGLQEVVEDGQTGFLIPPDENAIANIVMRLKQLAQSPDLLESMKNKARNAFLEKFTVPRMVETAEKIYFSAARGHS